jgi:hypothetical protein
MRSHLPTICISLAACSFGIVGCQMRQQRTTEPMSDMPLVIDEATQKRDFPKTEAMYPNGAVAAGSTWETIEPRSDLPYNTNALTETPISMANILMAPWQMFRHWQGPITYPGAMVEPSYNAMPAVPESASQQPQSERTAEVPNKNTSNNASGNKSATPAVSP